MRLAAYQFAVCGDIDHNLETILSTEAYRSLLD